MRATPDVRLFIMQKNRTGPPGIYHLVYTHYLPNAFPMTMTGYIPLCSKKAHY